MKCGRSIYFSSILQIWYVDVQLSQSISESPLTFTITRTLLLYQVNKRTQDLIQSEPYQAPNTKEKDRQIQLSSHILMNRWQAELATLPYPPHPPPPPKKKKKKKKKKKNEYSNLTEYIINLHDWLKKNIRKWNTTQQFTKRTTMKVKYRLGTVSNEVGWAGGGGRGRGLSKLYGIPTLALSFYSDKNIYFSVRVEPAKD